MSKDRLLSDEELAEKVNYLVGSAVLKNDKNYSWEILDLINTQKRLYAESVIGEDDAIDNEYGSYSSQEVVNSDRNELREEQRARIE